MWILIHGGIVHPSQVAKYFTEGPYNPPKWLNNSRGDSTPLPNGQIIHGGTVRPSQVAK